MVRQAAGGRSKGGSPASFVATELSDATQERRRAVPTTWPSRNVLVTGGASFIGSTLVDALVERGANIRVSNVRRAAARSS
jgi:hypothetical protein